MPVGSTPSAGLRLEREVIILVMIIEDLIPRGRRNRPGYRLIPRYITIHDTANPDVGADAQAHGRYLKGDTAASIPASWHYTVDRSQIVQHLPLDENGWHAGDGTNGPGNRESIGIEICENSDGNRSEAEKNAAWLTAMLLRDFSLGRDRVKQHHHWSGKNCPRVLRGRPGGWDSFLEEVRRYLEPAGVTPLAGKALATMEQAQAWARLRQAQPRFVEIASAYWHYGALTGLRPEVLYAQSAKETALGRYGGAVQPAQNNWAGIKVESPKGDSSADFESFATPEEGVRGHFNHMCAYVGLAPVGIPHGRYRVVLAQPWAGQIRYVEELGGRWATGADYGVSIVRDYLAGLLATPPPVVEPPQIPDPPPELPPEPDPPPGPPEAPAPGPELPEEPAPGGPGFLLQLLQQLLALLRALLEKLAGRPGKPPEGSPERPIGDGENQH